MILHYELLCSYTNAEPYVRLVCSCGYARYWGVRMSYHEICIVCLSSWFDQAYADVYSLWYSTPISIPMLDIVQKLGYEQRES